VPALTAAKCAEAQGPAAFDRFHRRLFAAHFGENLDIGQPAVLWRLARECGLDVDRLARDYASGEAYQAVLHDYAEGAAWFGVSAVPTVVLDEKLSLVGAVPAGRYRALIDWLEAGAPGQVIALRPGPGEATAPGSGAPGPGPAAGHATPVGAEPADVDTAPGSAIRAT
jgi:predicted DsbA family dithiol-disulfide isomerase